MTHTKTRQITLRATDEQDAQLQALRTRWGLSQEATFWRAVREALEPETSRRRPLIQTMIRTDRIWRIGINQTDHVGSDGLPDADWLWNPPPGEEIVVGDGFMILTLERG